MRISALLLATALAASAASAQTAGPAATKALTDEIARKDRELFDAVFETCDIDKLATLVADDFEFYHDKNGLSATSGKQWVDAVRGMCQRQKEGTDYRARRVLVEGTLKVYPINNYGAVQNGTHRFYKKTLGQPDELVEVAQFTNLWKREGSAWKLTRVLSYDHRLTK
jgi:hypothetical protein